MKIKTFSKLLGLATLYLALPFGAQQVQAASITWGLGCVITDGVCTDSALSWGTVKIEDTINNGFNAVKITVDLVGTDNKILSVGFNYDDSRFNNNTPFEMLSGISVKIDENDINFSGGYKDLDIVPLEEKNSTSDPWVDIIYIDNTSLTVDDFNFTGGSSNIYTAVHIGNYGTLPGTTGNNSITVGSKAPIPEPTVTMLFALGVAGFAGMVRRNVTKR